MEENTCTLYVYVWAYAAHVVILLNCVFGLALCVLLVAPPLFICFMEIKFMRFISLSISHWLLKNAVSKLTTLTHTHTDVCCGWVFGSKDQKQCAGKRCHFWLNSKHIFNGMTISFLCFSHFSLLHCLLTSPCVQLWVGKLITFRAEVPVQSVYDRVGYKWKSERHGDSNIVVLTMCMFIMLLLSRGVHLTRMVLYSSLFSPPVIIRLNHCELQLLELDRERERESDSRDIQTIT